MLFSTVWSVEFIDFVETLLLNWSFHSFVTVKSLSNDAVLRGILLHPSCYSMSGITVSFSRMYLKSNAHHLIFRSSGLVFFYQICFCLCVCSTAAFVRGERFTQKPV